MGFEVRFSHRLNGGGCSSGNQTNQSNKCSCRPAGLAGPRSLCVSVPLYPLVPCCTPCTRLVATADRRLQTRPLFTMHPWGQLGSRLHHILVIFVREIRRYAPSCKRWIRIANNTGDQSQCTFCWCQQMLCLVFCPNVGEKSGRQIALHANGRLLLFFFTFCWPLYSLCTAHTLNKINKKRLNFR